MKTPITDSKRVFVAIDCTPIKEQLTEIQKQLYPIKARYTQSFHLTLKFIGSVPKNQLLAIHAQLKKVKHKPFTITVDALGEFSAYSQKVIWAGTKHIKALYELQADIEQILVDYSIPSHKFSPHITLARIKKHRKLASETLQYFKMVLERPVNPFSFEVNRFHLVESIRTKQGTLYQNLMCYEF